MGTDMAKRVTIDLTPEAETEVARLKSISGLTTSDLFRYSITLLRIYTSAKADGREVRIVDPKKPAIQSQIELPFFVKRR